MTPEEVILTVLEPIEGLRHKVYPAEAIKNAAAPFVFYVQHSDDEEESLEGLTGLKEATFEINCVAKNYSELVWLVGSVRSALQAMQGRMYNDLLVERASVRQASPDIKEKEVGLYRRMLQLELHYQKEDMTNE